MSCIHEHNFRANYPNGLKCHNFFVQKMMLKGLNKKVIGLVHNCVSGSVCVSGQVLEDYLSLMIPLPRGGDVWKGFVWGSLGSFTFTNFFFFLRYLPVCLL